METIGQDFVAFLGASKSRDVAAHAALHAVDEHFHHSAVDKLVCVRGIVKSLLRVVVDAELKGFVGGKERNAVFAAHFEPSCFAVVAVFLRHEIVVFKIFDFAVGSFAFGETCIGKAVRKV